MYKKIWTKMSKNGTKDRASGSLVANIKSAIKGLRSAQLRNQKQYRLLKNAPHLFNPDFYLRANLDLVEAGIDPISHYLLFGAGEGRNPSAVFDTPHYLSQVSDLPPKTNPLVHFLENDGGRTISPTPYFDHSYYKLNNPSETDGVENLFEHYAQQGMKNGLVASPKFDPRTYVTKSSDLTAVELSSLELFILGGADPSTALGNGSDFQDESHDQYALSLAIPKAYADLIDRKHYLEKNPDVRDSRADPVKHFRMYGWMEGRSPNPFFDPNWYRSNYMDRDQTNTDPLLHYCEIGWKKMFDPSSNFSVERYLALHPNVAKEGIEPLAHFLQHAAKTPQTTPVTKAAVVKKESPAPKKAYKAPSEDVLKVFNAEYYSLVNPDLKGFSNEKLRKHFIASGFGEGRHYAAPSMAHAVSGAELRKPSPPAKHIYGGRPQYSSPLVISGFHRSGTSLTSNLFHNAGLFLGKELLGANPSNPYGHFEAVDIVGFHDRLLANAGTYWQTDTDFMPIMSSTDWAWLLNCAVRNANFPAWGFKDPRNCLFLPQWEHVFPDMRVLYVFRPAVECVHSIKRRAARDLMNNRVSHINRRFWLVDDLAVRMYIVYATAFLRFAENFNGDICVVELDDIVEGRDIVSEVRDNWGYQLSDAYIGDIYDSSVMSRSGSNEFIKDVRLLEQLEVVESKLRAMARKGFTNRNSDTHSKLEYSTS